MVYKKNGKKKRVIFSKPKSKKISTKKPFGYIKQGKSYKFVYGTKTKPKIGTARFKTKSSVMKKYKSIIKQ